MSLPPVNQNHLPFNKVSAINQFYCPLWLFAKILFLNLSQLDLCTRA
jgi:hypothetical protein